MTLDEIMKYNGYKAVIYCNNIKITELESRATKCTAELSGMPPAGGTSDKVGNTDFDQIAKLKEENKLCELKIKEIEEFIELIQNPIKKQIARLRVYSNMEYWEISDTITNAYANVDVTKYDTDDKVKHIFYRCLDKSKIKTTFCA